MGLPLNSNWSGSIPHYFPQRQSKPPYKHGNYRSMSRRSKWNPIPAAAPSPKILHFPRSRRTRRKQTTEPLLVLHQKYLSYKGKLSDDENKKLERRERVEEHNGFAEEKWRFQAEMLTAESNLLRTERELAMKKLQKNRVKIEGREKIFEGEEELEESLKRLRIKDGKCSKKGFLLGEEKELQEQVRMKMVGEDDCSASTSKRIDRHLYQESMGDENKCSGRCKAVVRRIVEQVRAETEEWSQMQQMMRQVRGEMEELQISRDYWQNRARDADYQIQSLKHAVEEWKRRALDYEVKANKVAAASLLLKDEENKGQAQPQPLSLGKQLAKEKRMRCVAYTESKQDGTLNSILNRSPLRDIGNSSTLPSLHFRSGRSFRK